MKKKYIAPTTKSVKVRISNQLLETSPVNVSEEVNNEGYDVKEDINFDW